MTSYALPFFCVLIVAIGQIFFKLAAIELQKTGDFFNFRTLLFFLIPIFLFGLSSILWVIALKKFKLSTIYPISALAFVLVPLGSFFILDEKLSLQYMCGLIFILCGIILIAKS